MLNALITFSLKNRFVVLLLAVLLVFVGVRSALELPLDAFPDTTPNQVQINTVAPALTPEQIELLVTYPVELSLGGLKGLQEVRSVSKFGLSQVVAIFDDAISIYFARQQITERLAEPAALARDRQAADGPGRHRPRRDLPLLPDQRRLQPDRAADDARLGRPAPADPRPRDRRDQHAGRHGQAVRGPDRPGPAGEVPADARRRVDGAPARTTRTSAAARSTRPGRSTSCRASAWCGRPATSPTSSSPRSRACRSASATWPTWRSATRSAAAARPPTATARSSSAWPSCGWARTPARSRWPSRRRWRTSSSSCRPASTSTSSTGGPT